MRTYQLLSAERAAEIARAIQCEQWSRGKTSMGVSDVKVTDELSAEECPAVRPYLDEILESVNDSPVFQREMLSTAFYPHFNRYANGGEYQVHVDAAYMGAVRSDLAMTVFLNDGYEGGELEVETAAGRSMKVKAPPGYAVIYECWRPHRVHPVTKGERLVAVTWLQSRVPSVEDREILERLHIVIDDLTHKRMTDQERFAALGCVHDKLLKRFSH